MLGQAITWRRDVWETNTSIFGANICSLEGSLTHSFIPENFLPTRLNGRDQFAHPLVATLRCTTGDFQILGPSCILLTLLHVY